MILLFTRTNQLDIKSLQCPFGVQGRSTYEARRAEFTDGWMEWDGWMDGWMDGISKVSFKFLYTL